MMNGCQNEKIPGYHQLFQEVFGGRLRFRMSDEPLPAFSGRCCLGIARSTKYDIGGDQNALELIPPSVGLNCSAGKARCTRCHSRFNFTDEVP